MRDRFSLVPGTRVLHLSPEYGIERRLGRMGLEYVTGDAEPGAMVLLDLAALPFADERFDVAICNHVLPSVADDDLALRELRRVLVPQGRLLTQNPIDYTAETSYEGPDTVEGARRRFGRDFRDKLEGAGFETEAFSLKELADKPTMVRHGLIEYTPKGKRGNDIYVCTRR